MIGPRRVFRRVSPGVYEVALPDEEREILGVLVAQLRAVLEARTDDPTLKRLFPTAYNEDPRREEEYRQLTHDELLAHRLASLETVAATLTADELDEEQLAAWMGALNDLRLVLGTRLDVSEETDSYDVDPAHPQAEALAVYGWLGWLLEHVVDAASP